MLPIEEIKQISILDYLSKRGIQTRKSGKYYFFKSPLNNDSSWSCVVYPTNSFYDFSAGYGGSIIDLVMALENITSGMAIRNLSSGDYPKFQANYKKFKETITKNFEYTKYLTTNSIEIQRINEYALGRGWKNGYEYGYFPTCIDDNWGHNPSVMFLHRDEDGVICGAKFRVIDPNAEDRFSARGKLGFYILEYIDPDNFGEPTLYYIEGEGNANSLWQHCIDIKRNCVVISSGGVGQLPKRLPKRYDHLSERKLIIDFDGNEELYYKRVRLYRDFQLDPVKIILPKGEDINSLYSKGDIKLLNQLI